MPYMNPIRKLKALLAARMLKAYGTGDDAILAYLRFCKLVDVRK